MVRYAANHIRFAIIRDVNYDQGIAYIEWLDNSAEPGQNIPIPHPFAGRGEGIYAGVRPGTLVALDMTSYERYVPVAVLPFRGFYTSDMGSLSEARFDDAEYPSIEAGEMVVRGASGDELRFRPEGGVFLQNQFREGLQLGGDVEDSRRCAIGTAPPASYEISQAGVSASGLVRRDTRTEEGEFDTAVLDPLLDLEYEGILEEIGRDTSRGIAYSTRRSSAQQSATLADQFRNPPFVERRSVIYEFGADWMVDVDSEEETLMRAGDIKVRSPADRRERRSNVLGLSLLHPNELMEHVEGTLVDVFGNMLDINRIVLPPPVGNTPEEVLAGAVAAARRSVVLHREINTRKGPAYRRNARTLGPVDLTKTFSSSANNARDRSRWSMDVDKEGLTRINIPATSETGNIPYVARHENSSSVVVDEKGNASKGGRSPEEAKLLYRSNAGEGQPRKDIFSEQVGPGGIKVARGTARTRSGSEIQLAINRLAGARTSNVEGDSHTLPDQLQAGTAFHAITATASALLRDTLNRSSLDIHQDNPPLPKPDGPAVSSSVRRAPPSGSEGAVELDDYGRPVNYPNAGGRSASLSLDGSLDLSIGANTVDRVSWILDTAGGIVMRLGRDREGRSAVIHADGYLALEVGGFDFVGEDSADSVDTRFAGGGISRDSIMKKDPRMFRAGKVVIRVRRPSLARGKPDEQGADQVIIIDENGVSMDVNGQLTLGSSQTLTLKSESKIVIDSKMIQFYADDSRRIVIKNGKPII